MPGIPIDSERFMDEVISDVGGVRIETLLPERETARTKNCDYFFRERTALAELKSLKTRLFTPGYQRRLSELVTDWQNRDLIRVYGRARIEMRRLPRVCQEEWVRSCTQSLQSKVIHAANMQFKNTKKVLHKQIPGIEAGIGLLLVQNDANVDLLPHDLLNLLGRALRKTHEDGAPQYSCIHGVSVFSASLPVRSSCVPEGKSVYWLNGFRFPESRERVSNLQEILENSWYAQLGETWGFEIPRYQLKPEQLEDVRFL